MKDVIFECNYQRSPSVGSKWNIENLLDEVSSLIYDDC